MRRLFLLAILLAAGNAAPAAAADPPDPPLCSDGIDNDGDGAIDHPADPECASPDDESETPACSDGVDNDGDGATDYPDDPHCTDSHDDNEVDPEAPACSDGVDNDADGRADYPHDTGCTGREDPYEDACALALTGITGFTASSECVEDAPCADVLPPVLLHAEWTGQGIQLAWQSPLTGTEPTAYVIYRVPDGSQHFLQDGPDPLDAVPASETSYLDATAQAGRAYLYWLTSSAGTGCESTASAPAAGGEGIPDHAKCLYIHEDLRVTGPSTNCLDG